MRKYLISLVAALALLPAAAWAQYPTHCGTDGNAIVWSSSTGQFKCSVPTAAPTFSVNGTNNSTQTGLNAVSSTTNAVGLTVTPSNPLGNDWRFEITGGSYTGNAATATKLSTNGADTQVWGMTGLAQGWINQSGAGSSTLNIANASTTGTTLNTLTKTTGAPSTAVIAATTDTGGVVGVTTSGAGITGNATIQISGQANCSFDGATTAGDYVQISSTTGGDCHDAGSTYPTANQVVGRVLSTNAAAGTYQIDLFPAEIRASSGGGGGYTGCTGVTNGITCTGQLEAGTYLKADANAWGKSVENLQTATVADLATITTTNASILAVGSTVWVTDAASCGDTTVGGGSIKERLEVTAMGATSPTAWAVLSCFTPSSGGSLVPTTIPNLVYWFAADRVNWTNNSIVPYWKDTWTLNAATSSAGATYLTSQINLLPALSFPGSASGRYNVQYPLVLPNVTVFVVFEPTSVGSLQQIVGNEGSGFGLRLNASNHLEIDNATVVIGTDTATISSSVWYQGNVTYNNTTGAFAFRLNEVAGASGTNAVAITGATDGIGYRPSSNNLDFNGKIAEIIVYNRVLTSTEITQVESYLHSKYGI